MRILHTSDWHLGRQYNSISIKDEQQETLDEIADICDKKQIDVILIAGDIFNGINTPGYADEMFINSLIRLSKNGERAIIAISGNNDEGTRFAASRKFAETQNIYLIKNLSYDATEGLNKNFKVKLIGSGMGYLKFQKDNEILTIAYLPYGVMFSANRALLKGETIQSKIKSFLTLGEVDFEEKGKGLNFGLAHLGFKSEHYTTNDGFEFTTDLLDDKLDYVALGHRHNLDQIFEDKNIIYSGSTVQTYSDEKPNKYVVVINTSNNEIINKEFVKLKSPRKLVAIKSSGYQDCIEKLDKLVNSYVELTFATESIESDDIRRIKERYNFITKFNLTPKLKKSQTKENSLKKIIPEEIFSEFYEKTIGRTPSSELVDTFLEVLKGDIANEAD